MDLLLAFYSPGSGERPTIQRALLIAQKTILRFYERPEQEIQEQIATAIKEFWLQEPRKQHGQHGARGENLEEVMPSITAFARYYYEVIFLDMAKGERKRLQHRFRSLVRGCEAMYRERLHAAQQHKDGE